MAQAQASVTTWTDLNLRSGPGPHYPIIGVIPSNGEVMVEGCLEAASSCKVCHAGMEGWASGDYLTTMLNEAPVAICANRASVPQKTVVYTDTSAKSTAAGGVTGAIDGAIVAGPVGAILGAGTGAGIDPGPTVTIYVRNNPRDVIYVDGELVVGAGLPESVILTEIPDSTFGGLQALNNSVPAPAEVHVKAWLGQFITDRKGWLPLAGFRPRWLPKSGFPGFRKRIQHARIVIC